MYRKNTASQFIHFQGVDVSTGGIKSGVSWTVRRCIDGTFAAAGGTATEDGSTGWYKFAMSQADTNGNDIGFNFTGTGAVPQTVNILTDGNPPDVNVKNVGGTLQTPGDLAAMITAVDDFVDTEVSAIKTKTDQLTFTVSNQVDANSLSLASTLRSGIRKNTALAKFEFLMTDSTNHNPASGLTVTPTRSIDGAAFGTGTLGSVTGLASGIYYIDLPAADLNGNVIMLRFTATGADDLFVTITTSP